MNKKLIEENISSIKEILENIPNDNAVIMIASVNKDGNPILNTIEGAPYMPKDIVCMLLSAALTATRDNSTQGYFIEPTITHEKEIQ